MNVDILLLRSVQSTVMGVGDWGLGIGGWGLGM